VSLKQSLRISFFVFMLFCHLPLFVSTIPHPVIWSLLRFQYVLLLVICYRYRHMSHIFSHASFMLKVCHIQCGAWVAQWYNPGLRRFETRQGAGNFSLHHRVQTVSGALPASYRMGTRGSFPGENRTGREAEHSPSSSAEVKNALRYSSTPPICLHGVMLS
jgi:hypothetical protein